MAHVYYQIFFPSTLNLFRGPILFDKNPYKCSRTYVNAWSGITLNETHRIGYLLVFFILLIILIFCTYIKLHPCPKILRHTGNQMLLYIYSLLYLHYTYLKNYLQTYY